MHCFAVFAIYVVVHALMWITLTIVDVQVKVWRCLNDVRPTELQQTISEKQEQGTDLMPVIAKDHIKKLTSQQRRRWSQHTRAQREKANAKQQLKAEKSKNKRVQRAEN